MLDPTEFLRLVVDPHRLVILGAAARGPIDPDDLAEALGIPAKRVLAQVAKLQAAGLITPDRTLDQGQLRRVREQLPTISAASDTVLDGPWSAAEMEVLRTFFRDDRLDQVPASRRKRLVVLERLVQEFEPGIRYDERTVNFKLQMFHPDYASLRRYLVDEGLLTRSEGVYWRTGGRYDTDRPPLSD